MNHHELKLYLDDLFLRYNRSEFITDDPISIPHKFTDIGDIEISAFLTSIISWGQRKTILKNAQTLMEMMEHSPKSFIINASNSDYSPLKNLFTALLMEKTVSTFLKRLKIFTLNMVRLVIVLPFCKQQSHACGHEFIQTETVLNAMPATHHKTFR